MNKDVRKQLELCRRRQRLWVAWFAIVGVFSLLAAVITSVPTVEHIFFVTYYRGVEVSRRPVGPQWIMPLGFLLLGISLLATIPLYHIRKLGMLNRVMTLVLALESKQDIESVQHAITGIERIEPSLFSVWRSEKALLGFRKEGRKATEPVLEVLLTCLEHLSEDEQIRVMDVLWTLADEDRLLSLAAKKCPASVTLAVLKYIDHRAERNINKGRIAKEVWKQGYRQERLTKRGIGSDSNTALDN